MFKEEGGDVDSYDDFKEELREDLMHACNKKGTSEATRNSCLAISTSLLHIQLDKVKQSSTHTQDLAASLNKMTQKDKQKMDTYRKELF